MLLADGFDEALIGVGVRCGQEDIAVYSVAKCISVLESKGMTYEEAVEFFDYNVVGSWMGLETPMFLYEMGIELAREAIL